MRSRLRLARSWSHLMGPVSGTTSGSGHFAGMRFALVSPSISVSVIFRSDLVAVFSRTTCPFSVTFSYVPPFVPTVSCSLKITFGCVSDFVFTFARSGSTCSPESLGAFALSHAFVLVECLDRVGVRFALVHGRLEVAILGCRLLT